jgi:hypothetical protein
MNDFIQMIKKQYGFYIDLDIIEDPCTLPDYVTVKITASTAKYGGGKEVSYKFLTTIVTEHYLKEKIMEVVRMLLKGDNKQDLVVGRGYAKSMNTSIASTTFSFSMDYRHQIKKVIFNDPATIIFWEDGSKTVVKCQPDDKYDKMTGFAMACAKYMFGNEGNYYEVFKKWVVEEE